jgi:small subunit ribosomal protein S3Ae
MDMALKKQWYEIVAPKMFGSKVIGETLAVEPKSLVGRVLEVSLLDVIRDYSKFYIKLRFQIERVDGQKALTKFIGHDIMAERVSRMVQRHGRRVDVIEDVTTKDGVSLRVKVVFVLLRHVGTSMKDATRKAAREKLVEIAKSTEFETLVNMIIRGELAQEIRKAATKVYPVASIEIRKTEVMEGKKKVEIAA